MVRLNRIYTRTGDDGTTGLVDGSRRAKHDPRFEAVGAVDEANSVLGWAILTLDDQPDLSRVQNDLFDLGADLATPGENFEPSEMVLRVVPARAFEPAPEVESAVLVGRTRPRRLSREGETELWRLVQAGFRERRKMLHNVLARQLPVEPARVDAALATAGIDPDRRPQTLAVGEWLALQAALGPIGPDRRGRSDSP